jgi:acyl-CoA synthetase (AMP-forming)/AMP-acid ligase II
VLPSPLQVPRDATYRSPASATFAGVYPGAFIETQPEKPALIMANSGFTQTFAELDAAANQVSRMLRSAGVQPGDHVAICMENHDRFFEIIWGCHYAGAVYTACSSRLTSSELCYVINDCGAVAFITSMYKAEQAAEIVAETPNVALRLMLDGTIDGYESYETSVAWLPPTPLDEDRLAGMDMLYSSGTTGRPKGVTRAFTSTPLETTPGGVAPLMQILFGVTNDSVYLSPAPFYHAAPLRFSMGAHALGATVVAMEHFDAEQYLALVEGYRATVSQVVPTMFVRFLKLPPEVRRRYDVSSLQCVIHAAAPCPVPIKKEMIEWFGPIIQEYYAGTEGNGFVYCNSEMWLAHPGTVGTPINCVVHICDDDGRELPRGEPGTIFFEGGATFEYHNDAEKTSSSRHPLGWSTLGDVGYLDDDNFLYLTDRKLYMVITGGVNVYPQEAENVLITHPQVIDVAVFGVPNDEFGEEVKAVVQPATMPATSDEAAALAKELIAYCRASLSDVKCPRSIDFRQELPRHPTGKLYKRLLKDEYWAAAGRSI